MLKFKNKIFKESDDKKQIIYKLKYMKPSVLIEKIAKNDPDIERLEQGTDDYNLWIETLNDLNIKDSVSTKQVLTNIRMLKQYVKSSKNLDSFKPYDDDEDLTGDNFDINTTGRLSPEKTILDNKEVQELLCETARFFIRNIKQEFGNILIAFSLRLIGIMESLGYSNPARGIFYLIEDNSTTICSSIINAVSEYVERSPSVVGVQVERNTTDKRSLGLKHGVPTTLISELMKTFDEEVVTNPEEVYSLDSNNKEIANLAKAVNVSDLIHVNKSRKTKDGNTVYSAFRMQKGGYSTNFNYGMQIVPLTDSSFNVLFYMYLSDNITKPEGILPCNNWI